MILINNSQFRLISQIKPNPQFFGTIIVAFFNALQLLFHISMKKLKIASLLLLLSLSFHIVGQENTVIIQQSPEQEAIKQTEKFQQELNLNPEQSKQIYDINLKYARERQISNKRSEAVERMKNKNADIQQILNQEQNEKLQTKRYERTTIESQKTIRNQPINSSSFQPNSNFRPNQTVRIPSSDANVRSGYRPTNPATQNGTSTPQSVRRSINNQQQNQINQPVRTNPSPNQSTTPSFTPGRSENRNAPTRK